MFFPAPRAELGHPLLVRNFLLALCPLAATSTAAIRG
jgi:hypothetical protein